jgi:hypothetical protein
MTRFLRVSVWATIGLIASLLAAGSALGVTTGSLRGEGLLAARHPAPSQALASCPAPEPVSSLPVFARTAATLIPDDLTADANGGVWATVTTQGAVLRFAPDGTLEQTLSEPNGPEGIIVTPGRTFVANQLASRVDLLNGDGTLTPFLKLPDRTHMLAVDGLGVDVQRMRLLIPNSPEGTLLATPLSAAAPKVLATGLGRPVAAAIGSDGAIYVAAESKVGLVRIPARGGPAKRVGTVSNLDEVVSVGRLLYTTGAGDGTVRVVDPSTGADLVLATGGHMLQGLAGLPDGRLLLISSTTHTISYVSPCP